MYQPHQRQRFIPSAKGRYWSESQWIDIVRCARVAKKEVSSGLTPRTAMAVLRKYAIDAEQSNS